MRSSLKPNLPSIFKICAMKNQIYHKMRKRKTEDQIKLRQWSNGIKLISWILIVASLNLFSGCMNYFKVEKATGPVAENINILNDQDKKIILHLDDEAWHISSITLNERFLDASIEGDYISVLSKPVKPDGANRYRKKASNDQSRVLNEVHMYTTEMSRKPGTMEISVPLSGIQKIEVYEKDKAATAGSYALGVLGVVAGAYVLTGIILVLTSCPFIYTNDGEQYILAGEIYSGSVQPQLERNDFMKLPVYNQHSKDYQLKIANELKEIQHTNLMEMWVFDHSSDLEIGIDKYGKYHTLSDPLTPISATNFEGTDLTGVLEHKDSLFYTSSLSDQELPLTDGVTLEFAKPDNASQAKVLIRAKNSLVLDFMFGQFQDQFGKRYKRWNKKQSKAPEEQLMQWKIDQNIPLTLSVERNGSWEPVDYYHVAGPVAFKEDILSFPLTGEESNPMKIKLEAGNFFWEIDYVGIDYSEDKELSYEIVPASAATDQSGKDITGKIRKDDKKYYNQTQTGNNAVVTFEIPENLQESRSIFLHSKGWYHILRDPSGTPDREYLETFRQPGRFNQFVNEYIQKLAEY